MDRLRPESVQPHLPAHLKLKITRSFLECWFGGGSGAARLGHFGNGSRMDEGDSLDRHRRSGGEVPREIFLRKRAYAWKRPHFRPEQSWADYWPDWSPFDNSLLRGKGKAYGGRASFGKGGVEFVSVIGLRGDEPHRIQRIKERNSRDTECEGELIYTPLNEIAAAKADVNAFWDRRVLGSAGLESAPAGGVNLSNCVFCFLKGAGNLRSVQGRMLADKDEAAGFGPLVGTPCDLRWWSRIEREYGRDLKAENRETRSDVRHFGFFGNNGFSYADIAEGGGSGHPAETMLPCDCTE